MNKSLFMNRLRKVKFISNYVNRNSIIQLRRYLISGIIAFSAEYITFWLLLNAFDLQKLLSNSLAMFTGFWCSFLLNRFWSFESEDNLLKQFSLYSLLFVINLAISTMLMIVLSDILPIPPSISKIMIMGMIVAWNFIIYKKIVYKK